MKSLVLAAASFIAIGSVAMAQTVTSTPTPTPPPPPQPTPHELALNDLLTQARQTEEQLATQAYQLNQLVKELQGKIADLEKKAAAPAVPPATEPPAKN